MKPKYNADIHLLLNRLEWVGLWTWRASTNSQPGLVRPPFCDWRSGYSDLKGRQLTVAVMDFWPYFQFVADSNGDLKALSGRDVSLLNTLADKLNFT